MINDLCSMMTSSIEIPPSSPSDAAIPDKSIQIGSTSMSAIQVIELPISSTADPNCIPNPDSISKPDRTSEPDCIPKQDGNLEDVTCVATELCSEEALKTLPYVDTELCQEDDPELVNLKLANASEPTAKDLDTKVEVADKEMADLMALEKGLEKERQLREARERVEELAHQQRLQEVKMKAARAAREAELLAASGQPAPAR